MYIKYINIFRITILVYFEKYFSYSCFSSVFVFTKAFPFIKSVIKRSSLSE